MKDYLDIMVADAGLGHKIYIIGTDNSVVGTVHHLPWFTVYSKTYVPSVRGVVRVTPLRGLPLVWDGNMVYVPDLEYKVFKVEVEDRTKVPEVASSTIHGYDKAGLYNIRYEVRVAYDISKEYRLLGFNTPLVFKQNDEMLKDLEKAVDVISKLKVMAVDIEVLSRTGGFPKKGDPILSVAYASFRLGDNIFTPEWVDKNVKTIMMTPGADLVQESRRVVQEFLEKVLEERPQIIVTYNGISFDIPYMRPHVHDTRVVLEPTTIGVLDYAKKNLYLAPHIDLYEVRESLGSAVGLRSHVSYALDDVAMEIIQQLSKVYDLSWTSRLMESERLLNHAKLREYWERRDPLLDNYIVADVYLTCLIARVWLYPIYVLSLLTGIPGSVLQSLNTGQISEYLMVEYLRRLGFYPELRHRKYLFSKSRETVSVPGGEIFSKGKVYVYDYGVFGGNGFKVVELDFAQLYPTDMVSNSVDPTSIYIKGVSISGWDVGRETTVVLGVRAKKSESAINPTHVLKVVHGYGPLSFLMYKLYVVRAETKKIKKKGEKEGRPELSAPDQAVKILNNSFYGALSKERGNLVSELAAATTFWRTLGILYDVINFIDNEIPRRLGVRVKVIYGDTDSTYVLVPESLDPKVLASEVNQYVKQKYGELYEMSLEDVYDAIVIPKQKESDAPSGKSYICLKGGAPVKIKGEFFKLNAPLAIKEKLNEIYSKIIQRKPSTMKELEQIIREVIENEPLHKLFIKKSMTSFTNEDDPSKLKRLNKPFHYASLYTLYMYKSAGVEELQGARGALTPYVGWARAKIRVNPRVVEKTQRAVVTLYLPHPGDSPRKFYVYVSDDGSEVTLDHVVVDKSVVVEKRSDGGREFETGYVVEFSYKRVKMDKNMFIGLVMDGIRKDVITPLYNKLVPAVLRERIIHE